MFSITFNSPPPPPVLLPTESVAITLPIAHALILARLWGPISSPGNGPLSQLYFAMSDYLERRTGRMLFELINNPDVDEQARLDEVNALLARCR